MLFNPPRNSPRLLFATFLTISSICFLFQWQQDLSNSRLTWKLLKPQYNEIISPNARFQQFLPHLLEHAPSNTSLELPEGYLLVRIENIDSETERTDHLTLSKQDLDKSTTAHSKVLNLLPQYDDLITYHPHSRGIITVGGGSYTAALLVSIRMLRRTNCTLPIEVFIPTPEDYDPYSCDTVLAYLNAKCIILPSHQNTTIERYQYKSVALLFSSFENVLFLDADNFPIVDPTSWFDSRPFRERGMITWPDFWANTASPLYYSISNQSTPVLQEQHASTEAGSILISRSKHNRTLLLAFYYNLFGPGFYYELLAQNGIGGEGDKETWVAAANALGAGYYQVRERNHALLSVEGVREEDLDEIISMVQFDFVQDFQSSYPSDTKKSDHKSLEAKVPTSRNTQNAQIVFLHANRVKMNPAEVLERLDFFHGRQRMWGSREKTIERFGRDIEAEVWEEVIEVACRWGDVLVDMESYGEPKEEENEENGENGENDQNENDGNGENGEGDNKEKEEEEEESGLKLKKRWYGDEGADLEERRKRGKERVCDDLRRFWWKILLEEELEDRVRKAGDEDRKRIEERDEGWRLRVGHEDGVRRSG